MRPSLSRARQMPTSDPKLEPPLDVSGADVGLRSADVQSDVAGNIPDFTRTATDILFVCSSGGHLSQLITLRPWWQGKERRWVTFDLPDTRGKLIDEEVVAAYHPTTRNVLNLARNTALAIKTLTVRRPDVIISTGAAVAVPFFYVGALLRIPRIYIEVYDRFDSATLTGRLCRPFSTAFCVQTEDQLRIYRGARLIGPLL